MPLKTRLTEKLEITHPILSAPMAFVSGGKLAAAVSNAGGLGIIGGGYGDRDWLEEQFSEAGNTPVGCGFITWSLAEQPELLAMALERRPKVLFLSFGDPVPFGGEIADAGTQLICQVQTLEDARAAVDAGASVIVAQGAEAGGHGAQRGTLPLVPEVADYLADASPETVLCAAGGIADGRGLAAALMLGADGVLVGSRFTASDEALVFSGWQDAVLAASGDTTVQTNVVDIARKRDWPDRFSIRVIENELVRKWQGREGAMKDVQADASEAYEEAIVAGDTENYGVIVGENAGLIRSVQPTADIVESMVAEAEKLLQSASAHTVS